MVIISVELSEDHSLRFTRETRRKMYTATYYAIGLRWQDKWLKRHFTRRAREIYRYPKRTAVWNRRKEREAKAGKKRVKKGGRVDLVYTGLLERLASNRQAIRAYPTRATVSIQGPKYVTMTPQNGRMALGPQLVLSATDEQKDLAKVGEAELTYQMKHAPPRKRKIKGRG